MDKTRQCPTPDKKRFRSKAEARKFYRLLTAGRQNIKNRLRPYECPCGEHWHLTSMTDEQFKQVKREIDRYMGRLQPWQEENDESGGQRQGA